MTAQPQTKAGREQLARTRASRASRARYDARLADILAIEQEMRAILRLAIADPTPQGRP